MLGSVQSLQSTNAFTLKNFSRVALISATGLLLANCSGGVDSGLGVKPSPRVVAEGKPVPKGGGRDQVGRPYKVGNRTYVPKEEPGYKVEGMASWYGSNFHGRQTSNGEVFDSNALSAAHPTMPLPSYAKVTNLDNGRSIVVRVNDRGPFHSNRVVDVSRKTAEMLGFRRIGKANVRLEYVGRASLAGSDDKKLLATYDAGSRPAGDDAAQSSVMTASLTGTLSEEGNAPVAPVTAQPVPAAAAAPATAYPLPPSAAPTPGEVLNKAQNQQAMPSGGPYIPATAAAAESFAAPEAPVVKIENQQAPLAVAPDAPPEAAPAAEESMASPEARPSPASRIASAIPVTLQPVPLMEPAPMSGSRQEFVAPSMDSNVLKTQ